MHSKVHGRTADREGSLHGWPSLPGTRNLLLLVAAVFGWGTGALQAQKVVLSQSTLLGGLPNGGAYGSGTAAGTSMAVNSAGNLFLGTSYGGSLVEYNGSTGVETTLGSYSNIGPIAVDLKNNLYIGNVYSSTIIKLPYTNGAYPAFSSPSSTTSTCTGSDTAECVLASSAVKGPYGLTSMAFDTKGDLFYASTNGGSGSDHEIFELTAASLATAAPSPLAIYQEPTNANPYLIGGMAIDPTGNLFFADSAFINQGNEENAASYLNEIAYTGTGTTGYSTTKTVLYTDTIANPSNYDNILSSVAVNSGGTMLYFATESDGIFGFPMSAGVVTTSTLYSFSTLGAKVMTTDGAGNFYITAYSGATSSDAATHVGIGVLTAPQTNLGSTGTATNASTILNDIASCSSPVVTYKATSGTAATTEFSAATSGSCSTASLSKASVIPTTITFTPTSSGTRSATITATDANSSTGTATVTAIGVGSPAAAPTFAPTGGTYTSIQSVTISDATPNASIYYTTDGSTPTTSSTLYTGPITVAISETVKAIATAVGNGASTVASATYTITLPTATPTFSLASGTYNSTQTVVLSDTTAGATIYYTTDGSTPTTNSAVYTTALSVAATETINAIAVAPGYITSAVATVIYTIKLPTFALAINPSTVTIAASGGQALVNVTISPLNTFASTVSFACSGVPSGATCSFTPSTVTPSGTYTVTTVLAVTMPTVTSALHTNSTIIPAAMAFALCLIGWKRRRGLKLLPVVALMTFGMSMLSGCSGSPTASATATNFTVTVTATSGAIAQTGTLSVTAK